jgi:hypothetical protein
MHPHANMNAHSCLLCACCGFRVLGLLFTAQCGFLFVLRCSQSGLGQVRESWSWFPKLANAGGSALTTSRSAVRIRSKLIPVEFHLDSIWISFLGVTWIQIHVWIPFGSHVDSTSTWIPIGFILDSTWIPPAFHLHYTCIPFGFHLDSS